jgi:hypothetical protein
MRFRKLRFAFSAACVIACALLIALWARSYWWIDVVEVSDWYEIGSVWGEISIMNYDSTISQGDPWSYAAIETSVLKIDGSNWGTILGFKITEAPSGKSILVPDWFPIFLLAFLSFAPWSRHWKWRFSLRTLLLATTVVAVLLGFAILMLRK